MGRRKAAAVTGGLEKAVIGAALPQIGLDPRQLFAKPFLSFLEPHGWCMNEKQARIVWIGYRRWAEPDPPLRGGAAQWVTP